MNVNDRFEYTSIGGANVKKALVLVCASVTSSVLLGVASVEQSAFSPYFKLASMLFLLLSILVFVRFIGTRYLYKLMIWPSGEGELTVTELRGFFGKSSRALVKRTVCRISMSDVASVNVVSDEKEAKRIRRISRKERAAVYNYNADLFPNAFSVLKIEDADGISYVRFSPDSELLRLISDCISQ
jgi:hypothetical protein